MRISKIKNYKKTKKNYYKKLIGGVLSPNTASKKIQNIYRTHDARRSQKVSDLQELLKKGVKIYENTIQNIDFKGVNMSGKVFSQKKFVKAKFQNVNFKEAKFNSAKFGKVLADNSNFEKCEFKNGIIKESTFNSANFKLANLESLTADLSKFNKCKFLGTEDTLKGVVKLGSAKFLNCEITNSIFKFCDLHYTEFIKTNLEGTQFINNKFFSPLVVDLPIFDECNLDNVSFIDNPFFFMNIKSTLSTNGEKNTINNFKLIDTNPLHGAKGWELRKQGINTGGAFILRDEFQYDQFIFNNLEMDSIYIRDKAMFFNCTFNKLEMNNVQLYSLIFDGCNFIDCNFGDLLGFSNNIYACTFKNCNLSKANVIASDLTNSTFSNCNMDAIKIQQSILEGVKFNEDTILTNINFQHCTGMEGMNFRGLNLQNCIFGAVDGQNLRGCDFRDANLQGTRFDYTQIHGSNFTGANLNGSSVRQAEGSHETVGIPSDLPIGRATDTHKAFYNIRINKLLDFYKFYVNKMTKKLGVKVPKPFTSNRQLTEYTFAILESIIKNMDKDFDKEKLMTGLNSCFKERLDHYDFDQIIAGTDPPINFRELIFWAFIYMTDQSSNFKDLYVESLITDSTQAHGANGLSCAAGIIERFVTVMEQVASVLKDSIPEKKEEYEELIGIIENDPEKLIKKYMEEWFNIHKEGGEDEYREDTDKDILMKSYKEFLEEKFDVKNLRGDEKEKIEKLIIEHPDAGVDFLRNQIGVSFFFGGRKTRRYHNNYRKYKTKKNEKKK